MKIIRFKSIRTRLTFWFLILALLPLVTGILITYNHEKQSMEQEAFGKLSAIRDLKVQQVQNWIDEKESFMQHMIENVAFRELEQFFQKVELDESDRQRIENVRSKLQRHLVNSDDFYELLIINKYSREIIVSTNSDNDGMTESQFPSLIEFLAEDEFYIKDIHLCHFHDTPAMTISIPIRCIEHNGEHNIGILAASVQLEKSLYTLLSNRTGLGETGETYIVNRDAITLNELRWRKNAPLKLQMVAESAVKAARGETGISKAEDCRGEPVLAAYTHIPETGWGFVCEQDIYELNAPIRALINYFIILLIVSTLVIVLIVFWISKQISKPIVEMNTVAQKIKEGNYSVRNVVRSEDELGSLADTTNQTLDYLESVMATQKGVMDISESMIGLSSMQDFGSELLKQLMDITAANMGTFYILNEAAKEFEHFTSVGANEELLKSFSSENPQGEFGNAISKKKIFYLRNIPDDTIFKFRTTAGDAIPKEIITIPILIDNTVVALISLVNIHMFNKECFDILKQAWININSYYSSLLGNERTRIFAEQLTITNQQLEAQTEELQEQSEELSQQSEELQEQNTELEMQKKQVEEANRLKSEFLSNMSHELRTPLNSIMALSRVLIMQAKNKLTEEENNYLEIVERNGKQLLYLINDILDLSKIEAGKMDVNTKLISIYSILEKLKDNLMPIVLEKGLKFNLKCAADLPKIETDETKLHQVLQNIITNSVKFTEKGEIDINVNFDSKNVYVKIQDTGIGIPQDDLPHIFEEFRQVDGSSSRRFQGTGLGLAIASKMINILGGTIEAASQEGKGSTFRVILPIKWKSSNEQAEFQNYQPLDLGSKKETILVVDDNPKFVKYISSCLNEAGYRTIGTTSGKEALIIADEHQPFAITLDVIMPEMDGWEVLQNLKSKLRTKDIPVIMVSVSDIKDTGFALGAVGYIQKPVNKFLLISEINKISHGHDVVMIVDDSEIDRKQISQILNEVNINTIAAEGGKECIELLQENVPDVLVLDLIMPEMDGFQVLDKIRTEEKTKNLPVIIVTAKDLTIDDKAKLTGKVSSILAKSETAPKELLSEIKRIITELEKQKRKTAEGKIGAKILIVEDNESTVIQIKAVLENENYIVDVATGGKQALEYLTQSIPDGIILDLMMPDVDGFEVLNQIRDKKETEEIPVLILTAKDLTREDLTRLNSNNIQQMVQKGDIDIEGLLLKVKLMLRNEPKGKKEEVKSVKMEKRKKIENKKQIEGLPRVLIVEDNPDNMVTVKAIIGKKYEISDTADAKKALKKIMEEKPDLVLLDISLPKMDGIEVVSIIKSSDEIKDIPVVALTAKAMKEDKEMLLAAGFDDYVSKPIDQKILLDVLKKWLGK